MGVTQALPCAKSSCVTILARVVDIVEEIIGLNVRVTIFAYLLNNLFV